MFRRCKTVAKGRKPRTPERPPPPSIISANLRIIGNLNTDGDIQIDGSVEGDVRSRILSIGEKAVVNGAIAADTVRIAGAANGEVTARVVQLSGTARVTGDINHQSLSIDAGAYVQGLCHHIEPTAEAPPTDLAPQDDENLDTAAGGAERIAVSKTVPNGQPGRVKAVG